MAWQIMKFSSTCPFQTHKRVFSLPYRAQKISLMCHSSKFHFHYCVTCEFYSNGKYGGTEIYGWIKPWYNFASVILLSAEIFP